MRTRLPVGVTFATATLLLSSCSTPAPLPTESYAPAPPSRQHWTLRHRVNPQQGMRIGEQTMTDDEESTGVVLEDAKTRATDECFVSLSAPGHGGPDNMVGEKITTTFDGHPAVRNGAGAEGDYLMWRLEDDSWVEVDCSPSTFPTDGAQARQAIDRVAAAVELRPTTLRIPVDLELPDGVRPVMISSDRHSPGVHIYLQPTRPHPPRDELVIMTGVPETADQPTGTPTTVNGRPALVAEDDRFPVVWLQEQDQWVYVGASSSDIGPYPDRSGELPTITALAESLTFAKDLRDPGTWFSADKVFG